MKEDKKILEQELKDYKIDVEKEIKDLESQAKNINERLRQLRAIKERIDEESFKKWEKMLNNNPK